MKRMDSLSDLLMEELADLLSAEGQLIEALPKVAQTGESPGLKAALMEYCDICREHVHRLNDIFNNIGQKPQEVTSILIKGLITQSEEAVNKIEKSTARDVGMISLAQQMEDYLITKYKAAREHAADLGHTRIVELFTKTLNELRAMNFHFSELAQGMINVQTIDPQAAGQQKDQQKKPSSKQKGEGFYVPEGRFRRKGVGKKTKITDVSRFISEGNPNIQEPGVKGEEKEGKDPQDPEKKEDLS